MAKNETPQTPTAPASGANQNTPTKRTGVRFLKHGLLASPQAVRLTAPPTPGNFAGKMDLAFKLDGQDFILSVSQKSPDWADLVSAFGEPGPRWTGATVQVADGKALRTVGVRPIADAAGNAVAI